MSVHRQGVFPGPGSLSTLAACRRTTPHQLHTGSTRRIRTWAAGPVALGCSFRRLSDGVQLVGTAVAYKPAIVELPPQPRRGCAHGRWPQGHTLAGHVTLRIQHGAQGGIKPKSKLRRAMPWHLPGLVERVDTTVVETHFQLCRLQHSAESSTQGAAGRRAIPRVAVNTGVTVNISGSGVLS